MKIILYFEGGGDARSLKNKAREGFSKLLKRAGFESPSASTRACGSRDAAFRDFKTALETAAEDEYPVLLVDSEGPVTQDAWRHLQDRNKWKKPRDAENDQAQLMVQCMETWCVADQPTLKNFFGKDFRASSLPDLHDLEAVEKDIVQTALKDAASQCGKDKAYAKGKRSFELVGRLNPDELKKHLPHFVLLCDMLNVKLG